LSQLGDKERRSDLSEKTKVSPGGKRYIPRQGILCKKGGGGRAFQGQKEGRGGRYIAEEDRGVRTRLPEKRWHNIFLENKICRRVQKKKIQIVRSSAKKDKFISKRFHGCGLGGTFIRESSCGEF